jgi:arginine decarboxylase
MTYFVLNGTSTANQIVAHSAIVADDIVLADRNCHKSLNYALAITDAIPVYLHPSRNGYGIIGPIPASALEPEAIAESIASHPLASVAADRAPVYAVVTNSTYGPTLYATQSTHKLLAAFSQASMIHIRTSDRAPVEPARFNEAYMMHASTSPFYPMIAVLDVAAAMMDGPGGTTLTADSIREAIDFRKRLISLAQAINERDGAAGWFFGAWQPELVRDPTSGIEYPFTDAPDELLASEPACWALETEAPWHGFGALRDRFCMLDPIKVTITMPGMDASGAFAQRGIPAQIVMLFLDEQRIEIEKTGDYIMLVLFSIGMTKGKWETLLDGLLAFKRAYDQNTPLHDGLPKLAAAHPDRYGTLGLADLCDDMHGALRTSRMPALLDSAFDVLPEVKLTPADTYRRLVRGRTERLSLADMAGRTATVMVVPYPPGIPILMPGESSGAADGPLLEYLFALEAFDKRFPGFEHDIRWCRTRHQRELRDRMPSAGRVTHSIQRVAPVRAQAITRDRRREPHRYERRRTANHLVGFARSSPQLDFPVLPKPRSLASGTTQSCHFSLTRHPHTSSFQAETANAPTTTQIRRSHVKSDRFVRRDP